MNLSRNWLADYVDVSDISNKDYCDNNVLNVLAKNLKAFHLGAGVCHSVAIILVIYVADINEVSKPIS